MSPKLHLQLLPFERKLLRSAGRFVPCAEREEWRRSWTAELWHIRNLGQGTRRRFSRSGDLLPGLIRDALWLRTESWSRALRGTALICLLALLGLCALSALGGVVLHGSSGAFLDAVTRQCGRFIFASPQVLFVACVVAPSPPTEGGGRGKAFFWVRRQMFFNAKAALLLLLAFLLSGDLCVPLSLELPTTAEYVQVLLFVALGLAALRWAFHDQGQRCNECLALLAAPARVGRPSRNLLEWNGTELACRHGHGLLSIPELETSWHRSSEWTRSRPGVDQRAST